MSGNDYLHPGDGLTVADSEVRAVVTTNIDAAVELLNEAAALDPRFWALFDVMVPVANIVGIATPLELMQVNDRLCMAGVLGVINGLIGDGTQRISIILDNENGTAKRKFVATSIGFGRVEDSPRQGEQEPAPQAADDLGPASVAQ